MRKSTVTKTARFTRPDLSRCICVGNQSVWRLSKSSKTLTVGILRSLPTSKIIWQTAKAKPTFWNLTPLSILLHLCDPAVGSGHFLVSSLNEIIAIKCELGILADATGERFRDIEITIENDELTVFDTERSEFFKYRITNGTPASKEAQRLQKTLFHEKQTLIENCLFGVDINPNSVKICRLRLWIELLKNAYYKEIQKPAPSKGADDDEERPYFVRASANEYTELETLPNIDINIKEGNSLLSRFALDADLNADFEANQIRHRRLSKLRAWL